MADLGAAKPPYLRIAAELRDQIEAGVLGPGAQLPTITALADSHGVSINTVQKALGVLKAEGLIEGIAVYGTFVRADPGQ
jgi:DNA-binding GntR family transcriptional regulator